MPSTRSNTLKEQMAKATTRGQKQRGGSTLEKSIEAENSPQKVFYRYGIFSCLTRVTYGKRGVIELFIDNVKSVKLNKQS